MGPKNDVGYIRQFAEAESQCPAYIRACGRGGNESDLPWRADEVCRNRLTTPLLTTPRMAHRTERSVLVLRKQSILLCFADGEVVTLAEEGAGEIYHCDSASGQYGSRTPRPRVG